LSVAGDEAVRAAVADEASVSGNPASVSESAVRAAVADEASVSGNPASVSEPSKLTQDPPGWRLVKDMP
jgi:hypothetical protein